MGNATKIKERSIEDLLNDKKNLRNIGLDLARLGRRINPNNVINEIIYKDNSTIKDAKNLPAYRNNQILKKGRRKKTLDLFLEKYGKEKKEKLKDINNTLISKVFGKDYIEIFNYSQRKLNQTKKQRIGGEKLKDAYIFVHTYRTVEILKEFGANDYQMRLGFLHDIVEDLRDWRIKKRNKLIEEYDKIKNTYKNKPDKKTEILAQEIKRLDNEIKSAPEYDEIYNLLLKSYKSEGKEKISEQEAKLTKYHVRLLTRRVNEPYKRYAKRLCNGCFKDNAKNKIKSLTLNEEEEKRFYFSPVVVKLADSIDNTRRVREGDISDRISRLYHNLYFLREVNNLIYHSKDNMLIKLRYELIKGSKEEIENNIRDFEKEKDPTVESKLEVFKELKRKYNRFNITENSFKEYKN